MALSFDRTLEAVYGAPVPLSPLVTRVLANNPSPFTFRGTGVYLVGTAASVVVIDPGPDLPEHIAALKAAIGTRQVSHILVTHTHRDHSPAARPLKAWSGARIFACAPAPHATGGEGQVDEAHDHAFVPDITLRDGDLIVAEGATITAVATPGHTANHLCFALAEERALFSGDHVMGWSTSVIAPPDGDMAAYLESLEKLLARGERIYYPTHGSPITMPQDWLHGLITHRHKRAGQIARAVEGGADTVEALAAQLYPDLNPALRGAAMAQVKAHLGLLESQGRVAHDNGRWIRSRRP